MHRPTILLGWLASFDFDARVDIASGHKLAEEFVLAQSQTQELIELACANANTRTWLLSQIVALARTPVDLQHSSPFDVVLMSLLLVAEATGDIDLTSSATYCSCVAPNTFWARQTADRIKVATVAVNP